MVDKTGLSGEASNFPKLVPSTSGRLAEVVYSFFACGAVAEVVEKIAFGEARGGSIFLVSLAARRN